MTMWTVTQDERLRNLWERGVTCGVIGAEFGCSATWVSVRAQELGLPSRWHRRAQVCGEGDLNYLVNEAQKRGIGIHALRARIVQVVLSDRMIDAVLDDQDDQGVTGERTDRHAP